MGILDYLSKEKRHQKKVERLIKKANNKFTPKDYRQAALHELIELAGKKDEMALQGLLTRFTVNAEPSIEDEKEKEWVCDALIDIGQPTLKYISKALRSAESVNWVQRTFQHIVSPEEYKTELLDVLSDFDTEYERNPDRKLQTIAALADIRELEVAQAILPFLEDVDETVRFQSVVALAIQNNEVAREPMLKTMCGDESLRVRNEAIESFVRLEWTTQGFKKKVDAVLPKGFKHDKSGKILKLGVSQ